MKTVKNEFEEFNNQLSKYKSESIANDYAELMETYDRKKALLTVAYYVYEDSFDEVNYDDIKGLKKNALLKMIKEEMIERDGSDIYDFDSDEDTYSRDD